MPAPELWVAPNNPSLSNQIRFMLESLRTWLGRLTAYVTESFTYTDAQVPIGTVRMTISILTEPGWVELDGGVLIGAETTYPAFWNVAPSGWKSGSNINLPDMRERVPRDGVNAQLGSLIGSNTVTLTTTELPAHTHGVNFVSGTENQLHNHNPGSGAQFLNFTAFGGAQNVGAGGNLFPSSNTTNTENQAHNHNINGTSDSTGSGGSFSVANAAMYIKFVVRIQ